MGNVEGRLTGKQMFLQDKLLELKLDDKDIPVEEEEKLIVDGVEIDESLYTVSVIKKPSYVFIFMTHL